MLRGYAGHFDGAAAVQTRAQRRCPVDLVDLRRPAAESLSAVLCTGPAARKRLDALVARLVFSLGRLRTAASAALAGQMLHVSGSCAPKLHTTSRVFSTLPGNQRPCIY